MPKVSPSLDCNGKCLIFANARLTQQRAIIVYQPVSSGAGPSRSKNSLYKCLICPKSNGEFRVLRQRDISQHETTQIHRYSVSLRKKSTDNAQTPISHNLHEENCVTYSNCDAEPLDHLQMFSDSNLNAMASNNSDNTNHGTTGNNSNEEYDYFADMSFWPKPNEIIDYYDELVNANGLSLTFNFSLPKGLRRGTELQDDAGDNEDDSFGIELQPEGVYNSHHAYEIC